MFHAAQSSRRRIPGLVLIALPLLGLCQSSHAGDLASTPAGLKPGFPDPSQYYPAAALRIKAQGTADVLVCIGADGRFVRAPEIVKSSGSPILDDGALRFAKAISGYYQPATLAGRPQAISCMMLPVRFHLANSIPNKRPEIASSSASTRLVSSAAANQSQEDSLRNASGEGFEPFLFVNEYIRELDGQEALSRAYAAEKAKASMPSISEDLYFGTRIQAAFDTDIEALRGMKLTRDDRKTADLIEQTEAEDVKLFTLLNKILLKFNTAALNGPTPGTDYGAIESRVPVIRALIDHNDLEYIRVTPLVFASLIDLRPAHRGHLLITCAQRRDLDGSLHQDFGSRLGMHHQNAFVTAASVLESYLHKGWKCADEP